MLEAPGSALIKQGQEEMSFWDTHRHAPTLFIAACTKENLCALSTYTKKEADIANILYDCIISIEKNVASGYCDYTKSAYSIKQGSKLLLK